MRNPFDNEDYGIASSGDDVVLISTDGMMKLSKAEARLLGRALIATADDAVIEARQIGDEAALAKIVAPLNSVGTYYAPDGTLMNADGTRSIFDDVDK